MTVSEGSPGFHRSRTGKKGSYAAYYLHVQPGGNSFIGVHVPSPAHLSHLTRRIYLGGGLWHPESSSLESLRDDIDQNPQGLKGVLMNNSLRRDFFKGAKDEKAAIAAFLDCNSENALKTKPRVSLLHPLHRPFGNSRHNRCR